MGSPQCDVGPRRPVLRFWLIATALEVVLAGALLLSRGDAAIERALDAASIAFNTDLVTAVRLGIAYPAAIVGIALSVAQVAAPDLAVLFVTRRVREGPGTMAAVRARFRFWSADVGSRRGLCVWAQMIGLFLALSLATAALDSLWLRPEEYVWPHLPCPSGCLAHSS